jgi:hypothetical protein
MGASRFGLRVSTLIIVTTRGTSTVTTATSTTITATTTMRSAAWGAEA